MGGGRRGEHIVDEDDSFARALALLANRWFWWFFLGRVARISIGDVEIRPLGWVTAPLVLIALWRLVEVVSGPVRRRLQQAFGCGVIAAVVTYIGAPVLSDAHLVTLSVGHGFLMLGMAAFASGLRTHLEHRGGKRGLVNSWAWAGRWAWVNVGAAAGVAVAGVVLDETDLTSGLDGWAALGWVPILVVAVAPFLAAAMATHDLRGALDRQRRRSR